MENSADISSKENDQSSQEGKNLVVQKSKINIWMISTILLLFLVMGAVGVFLTRNHNLLLKNVANLEPHTPTIDPKIKELETKKQSLRDFYSQIAHADNNQDWNALYKLLPESFRENVTEQQFITSQKKLGKRVYVKTSGQTGTLANLAEFDPKIYEYIASVSTTINSVEVVDNKGMVDRTVINCLTTDCAGENRKEQTGKKIYEYINGKWQIPDPAPSERALKATNYVFGDMSTDEKNIIVKNFSNGSDNSSFTVRNWALYLDSNLEELIRLETLVDKSKAENSRPIYNQQPAQIIQQQPATVIQQNSPTHCTSNSIGDYTYTNCY